MKKLYVFCFLLFMQLAIAGSNDQAGGDIRGIFLYSGTTWSGEFQNFVNRGQGIEQKGRIRVEMSHRGDSIGMRNAFINELGVASDYSGYAWMLVRGNELLNLDQSGVDANTGNPISGHDFRGRIFGRHIYIYEAYSEHMPDGTTRRQSNSVHYYLVSSTEVLQLAEVWVDDQLLVVAGARLEREI